MRQGEAMQHNAIQDKTPYYLSSQYKTTQDNTIHDVTDDKMKQDKAL